MGEMLVADGRGASSTGSIACASSEREGTSDRNMVARILGRRAQGAEGCGTVENDFICAYTGLTLEIRTTDAVRNHREARA
jgi:hypothetical protein